MVVGKGKITAGQMRGQLEEIAKKLSAGYTDREIMKDLKIPRSTFYRYKSKIFGIFGDLAAKKTEKVLEFESEILKDRYIRLYRNLEQRVTDRSAKLDAVANGSDVAAAIATNIFRLEMEGLRARQGRLLQQSEQKAARYLGNNLT